MCTTRERSERSSERPQLLLGFDLLFLGGCDNQPQLRLEQEMAPDLVVPQRIIGYLRSSAEQKA